MQDTMKILSIFWGFSLGGVAKYGATIERVRELIPVSLRSLCILPKGRFVDHATLSGLDAIELLVRSVVDPSWILRVRKIIAEEDPDCIMSHGFNGHLVSLIGCPCTGGRIRRLTSYHGSYHATTSGRRLVEQVYNSFTHWFLRRKATAILSVARYCADFLIDQGVAAGKITVVHNGIPDYRPNEDAREAVRREWGFKPEHILIGTASRLDPVKGLNYLLEAFARIKQDYPSARLVLMGEGTVRSALEDQAASFGLLEKVFFAGMRSDVSHCLTALDVFALPSLVEYHSFSLLEAMRAGLPITTTDVGGNSESVRDDREGLIVNAADADGLADAIRRMLDDPSLRVRLGNAARKRFISEFTDEAMLHKTAAWLKAIF